MHFTYWEATGRHVFRSLGGVSFRSLGRQLEGAFFCSLGGEFFYSLVGVFFCPLGRQLGGVFSADRGACSSAHWGACFSYDPAHWAAFFFKSGIITQREKKKHTNFKVLDQLFFNRSNPEETATKYNQLNRGWHD